MELGVALDFTPSNSWSTSLWTRDVSPPIFQSAAPDCFELGSCKYLGMRWKHPFCSSRELSLSMWTHSPRAGVHMRIKMKSPQPIFVYNRVEASRRDAELGTRMQQCHSDTQARAGQRPRMSSGTHLDLGLIIIRVKFLLGP
jgi:hypothetical protein